MDSRKNNSPNPNNHKKDIQDNIVNSDSNLDKPIEISFDQLPESANDLTEIRSIPEDTVFSALSSDPELSSAELSANGLSIAATFTTASAPMLPAIGASNFFTPPGALSEKVMAMGGVDSPKTSVRVFDKADQLFFTD